MTITRLLFETRAGDLCLAALERATGHTITQADNLTRSLIVCPVRAITTADIVLPNTKAPAHAGQR